MHFDSMIDFWAMGGYAYYVWTAFAITLIALFGVVVSYLLTRKKLLQEIRKNMAREQRIKKAQEMENTL